ncbi:hypothetical protein GOBAR_DD01167 [Gossypium barbadense]|nr:hypothetical protein GOBAR_DD01167 [Gossypium barbadense]
MGVFKSSPWYVRFGKFQGILKTREKVVTICVNGIEANFHMFLDHTGEAYFLREVDGDEEESEAVSFPFPSGYETDEPSSAYRRPLKSKSCNFGGDKLNSMDQIDVNNMKIVARTTSQQSEIFGHVFGLGSEKEDDYREDGGGVMRLESLERAEIAAGLLEMKWSTNIVSDSSNGNASPFSSTNDALDDKEFEEDTQVSDEQSQLQSSVNDKEENSIGHQILIGESDFCKTSSLSEGFMEEKSEIIANNSGTVDGNSVGNSDLQCQYRLEACKDEQFDGEPADDERSVNKETVSDRLQSFVPESSVRTSDGSSEQTHETLCLSDEGNGEVHVHAETLVRTTELVPEVNSHPMSSVLPSESSEDEQFVFSDLAEFKHHEPDCINKDHPSICTESEEVNGLCNVNSESLDSDKFVEESPAANMENSIERSGIISDPISIFGNHGVVGEKDGLQVESLPIMQSPTAKLDSSNNCPVSHSLDSTFETIRWTSIRKDDSNEIRSDADEEQQSAHESSSREESETSGKLKNIIRSSAVEISFCKHLLYEGMGAEAARQAFDAEKLDNKKFSSLGETVVKNDRLVVRIDGHYFPWDAAAPILLGMVTFGSEKIIEPTGMIPIDRLEKSVEGGPSKAIVTQSRKWRLWPFSLKRSRSRKAAQPVKKMIRAITPTSEQLASLNLKDGMNQITFTFSTAMLGKQQVDARIYLWHWNTHVVISDVDGTITKSDVLGQFMPLVGMDWSQTGVAHLFSAIKENGYQLLFLSARAISQAYLTRQFLANLKQDGKALPDGPIVISPDGLFPSLYREVIRRAPHEFKIACLEEIKALFPSDCNPFYAGFGNRDTDEISYLKVGIPRGKIFIINPKGEVVVNRRVDTKSYSSLHALVHGMFPPMASHEQDGPLGGYPKWASANYILDPDWNLEQSMLHVTMAVGRASSVICP